MKIQEPRLEASAAKVLTRYIMKRDILAMQINVLKDHPLAFTQARMAYPLLTNHPYDAAA